MKIKPLTKAEKRLLKKWEPEEDIKKWAALAGELQVQWRSVIDWNHPRARGCIHASSFTRSCDMFLYMERMGCESRARWGSKTQRIMDRGTAVHEIMHYYQGTRGLHYGYEANNEVWIGDSDVAKELHICGSCDEVTVGWPLDIPVVWEYKSINLRGFNSKTKPDKSHILQAHVYMGALGVSVCVILFYCTDNAEPLCFIVEWDPKVWDVIEKRARKINEFADLFFTEADPGLPQRHVNQSCHFCAYRMDCEPPLPKRRGSAPEV